MTTYKLLLLDSSLAQRLFLIFEQRSTKFIFCNNNTIVTFCCQPLERAYIMAASETSFGDVCNAIDQVVTSGDMEALTLKYEFV